MSTSVNVVLPATNEKVVAGASGIVHATVQPAMLAFPSSVKVSLANEMGCTVLENSAPVSNNCAYATMVWPNKPGTYTLSTEVFGELGISLAHSTQALTVVAASGDAPPTSPFIYDLSVADGVAPQ